MKEIVLEDIHLRWSGVKLKVFSRTITRNLPIAFAAPRPFRVR